MNHVAYESNFDEILARFSDIHASGFSVSCGVHLPRCGGGGGGGLLPPESLEVGDDADVDVLLHLLGQSLQHRLGDAAHDSVRHEAHRRWQDAADGDLEVAPQPAGAAAAAPVGVERPADAEVEARRRVVALQPTQLPLRLRRALRPKQTNKQTHGAHTVHRLLHEAEMCKLGMDFASPCVRTIRRSSTPSRWRSCMTTTGCTVRRRNCSGSIWTLHSSCTHARTQDQLSFIVVAAGEVVAGEVVWFAYVAEALAPALVGEHGAEHAGAVEEVLVERHLHTHAHERRA